MSIRQQVKQTMAKRRNHTKKLVHYGKTKMSTKFNSRVDF